MEKTVVDARARWNIIRARRRGTLTMEQLKEEIIASDRRQREDENGILDEKPRYDSIDCIIQNDTVRVVRIW